jgi:hypothetical protein
MSTVVIGMDPHKRSATIDHRAAQAGPGGHVGASLISSAAGSYPGASSSDKSLPGPTTSNATPSHRAPETVSLT